VASETFTSTSAPIQYAAVRAFQGGSAIEEYLWQSRRILGLLGRDIHARLRAAGADVVRPAGGFYLFPDFSGLRERLATRGISTAGDLCRHLLRDTGAALLPGTAFGRPPDELTARLAYVDFDGTRCLAAATHRGSERLPSDFAARNCAHLIEGVDRLCAWLRQD
jgi:aspartate aminotransferase